MPENKRQRTVRGTVKARADVQIHVGQKPRSADIKSVSRSSRRVQVGIVERHGQNIAVAEARVPLVQRLSTQFRQVVLKTPVTLKP